MYPEERERSDSRYSRKIKTKIYQKELAGNATSKDLAALETYNENVSDDVSPSGGCGVLAGGDMGLGVYGLMALAVVPMAMLKLKKKYDR